MPPSTNLRAHLLWRRNATVAVRRTRRRCARFRPRKSASTSRCQSTPGRNRLAPGYLAKTRASTPIRTVQDRRPLRGRASTAKRVRGAVQLRSKSFPARGMVSNDQDVVDHQSIERVPATPTLGWPKPRRQRLHQAPSQPLEDSKRRAGPCPRTSYRPHPCRASGARCPYGNRYRFSRRWPATSSVLSPRVCFVA